MRYALFRDDPQLPVAPVSSRVLIRLNKGHRDKLFAGGEYEERSVPENLAGVYEQLRVHASGN